MRPDLILSGSAVPRGTGRAALLLWTKGSTAGLRLRRGLLHLGCGLLLLPLLPGGFALPVQAAETPQTRLQQVEEKLVSAQAEEEAGQAKATELGETLARRRKDAADAADAVRSEEERLATLSRAIVSLEAQEKDMLAGLDLQRSQISGVVTALQRLATRPPESLLALPVPPNDTVRTAILLRAIIPNLQQQADVVKNALTQLGQTRNDLTERRRQQLEVANRLAADRHRLTALRDETETLLKKQVLLNQDRSARIRKLATEAKTLQELAAKLEQEQRDTAARARQQAQQRTPGQIVPVAAHTPPALLQNSSVLSSPARRLVDFGQSDETGSPSRGVLLGTRPGAQVQAPVDGTIVFAGPFRGYGMLLIIEHDEGYHTLLSGMARLDAVAGQSVLAGEPVGVMDTESEDPRLYVELRRQGQPVAPTPWLPPGKPKVSE